MPLPSIKHPVFKLVLPSTQKTISYRPYTVQEEKLLLIVRLSDTIDEIIDTIKQIIKNCVLDDIDVDSLAMFDIEFIFLNIRKVSVSNVIELNYNEDNVRIPFEVDLDQVKVKFDPAHTNTIKVDESIGMQMRYPNVSEILKLEYLIEKDEAESKIDDYIFDIFLQCVDKVYDSDAVYTDFTKEEMNDFVANLPSSMMKQIKSFFETMPVLEHVVDIKMPDGTTRPVKLKGLKDFFIF